MVTHQAILTALQSLDIAGVKKVAGSPPRSVNDADLPIGFPTLPESSRGEFVTTCTSSGLSRQFGFVILVRPVALSDMADNYSAVLEMMDNAEAALQNLDTTAYVDWTMSAQGDIKVAEVSYWGIVIQVDFRDYR